MMKTINLIAILLFATLIFNSCEKDPVITNEEEVITTVEYTLVNQSNVFDIVILRFTDLDGDGGEAPIIKGGTFQAQSTYFGSLSLLNETADPTENVTNEIIEEAEDHQFFFSSTISGVNVAYTDSDSNEKPVGVETKLSTGNAGNGQLSIVLRHKPNKEASGVSDGNIANAGGETDIEVTIPIDVE